MEHIVNIKGNLLPVKVSWKKMTQVRLKVFPSSEIRLSVPIDTPDEWIEQFLREKTVWIEGKLDLFDQTKAIEKEGHIVSGTSTRILGRQLTIHVIPAKAKQIAVDDTELLIYTTEADQEKINRQFENWWQKSAKLYFQDVLSQVYPAFVKHGVDQPKICVKKMKTLWGSCSRNHGIINLNYYLYKASKPCVEYVILHEMTHFLFPHHDKNFYDFLTIYMPDWQERKKQLDYEFVLGI